MLSFPRGNSPQIIYTALPNIPTTAYIQSLIGMPASNSPETWLIDRTTMRTLICHPTPYGWVFNGASSDGFHNLGIEPVTYDYNEEYQAYAGECGYYTSYNNDYWYRAYNYDTAQNRRCSALSIWFDFGDFVEFQSLSMYQYCINPDGGRRHLYYQTDDTPPIPGTYGTYLEPSVTYSGSSAYRTGIVEFTVDTPVTLRYLRLLCQNYNNSAANPSSFHNNIVVSFSHNNVQYNDVPVLVKIESEWVF